VNISGNGKRLATLTLHLLNEWHQTKEYWRDAKAQEFDHKYMEELSHSVGLAVSVIEQLDKVVATIRKDCE
jgi:hypothetical protein